MNCSKHCMQFPKPILISYTDPHSLISCSCGDIESQQQQRFSSCIERLMMGKSVAAIIITIRPTINPPVGRKQEQWVDLSQAEQASEKKSRTKTLNWRKLFILTLLYSNIYLTQTFIVVNAIILVFKFRFFLFFAGSVTLFTLHKTLVINANSAKGTIVLTMDI